MAGVSQAQHQVGFTWERASSWTPGSVAGSIADNPSPDPLGDAVWQYEWMSGGALGSPNEWYSQSATRSVWDPNWFGISQGAWARANNSNPPVFATRMTHNLAGSSWEFVPAVRWINPVGDCAKIDIAGSLTIAWSGEGGLGAPVDAEVVIAMENVSNRTHVVVLQEQVSKPTPVVSAGETSTIQVDIRGIDMDEGDSIIVSCRGVSDTGTDGRWIVLFDDLVIENMWRAPCDETIVAVIGDFGNGSPAEAAVADLVTSWDPDFIVTVGDNNYGDLATGWEENVGAFYGQYILQDSSSGNARYPLQTGTIQRFFPAVGNHDTDGHGGSAAAMIDYFHDRAGGGIGRLPVGTGNIDPFGMYYDFVAGEAHFWIVDSDHGASRAAQKEWLEQGLAASTSQWNLVFVHHPPFSSALHGNSTYMQWPFQEWGADVVLSGHDHSYELLVVNDGVYHDFPFFVNGLGGRRLYEFTNILPWSVARYNEGFGAQLLKISRNSLEFTLGTVGDPGDQLHHFELTACAADCDRSTGRDTLDIFDFLCFQAAFTRSEAAACDCDTSSGAGVCDVFDFLCFQRAFVAGCP